MEKNKSQLLFLLFGLSMCHVLFLNLGYGKELGEYMEQAELACAPVIDQ